MTPLTTVVRIDAAFRRYTRDGPGPFFTGTDDQLVRTAACGLHRRTRDEAMPAEHYRVQVPTSGFLSGVIDVTDRTVLQAEWVPSSAGDRVIRFFAVEAAKPPAGTAELIVRRDRESEWSVVGMSVRRRRNPDPPTPLELLRRPTVDSGDLLASVLFWSRRASIPPAAPAPGPARHLPRCRLRRPTPTTRTRR